MNDSQNAEPLPGSGDEAGEDMVVAENCRVGCKGNRIYRGTEVEERMDMRAFATNEHESCKGQPREVLANGIKQCSRAGAALHRRDSHMRTQ